MQKKTIGNAGRLTTLCHHCGCCLYRSYFSTEPAKGHANFLSRDKTHLVGHMSCELVCTT